MPMRSTRALLISAFSFACLASFPAAVRAQSPHCATARWLSERFRTQAQKSTAAKRSSQKAANPRVYRTFLTDHFSIHYSLRGINRVKTSEPDSALVRAGDSLFKALGNTADAAVYSRLDEMGAAQPAYVLALAGYLEQARGYYVGALGMRAPGGAGASNYYQAPADPAGRFPVDVANVGTAEPDYDRDPIYALTYPSDFGGILLDNDFLYRSTLSANGIPAGDSIVSRVGDKLIHNYSEEWDVGLKVTCFHEFYHAVQFAYTPEPKYHIWYETSAVGMEERNAPEVNDYLQYVPYFFSALKGKGMFSYDPQELACYGNGIYHVFLTQELGTDFDVRVWTRLAANGNDIKAALAATYASYGKTSRQVYSRFGAELAFSGTSVKMPMAPFSPDIPLWPLFPSDSADAAGSAPIASSLLPPMSMQAMKVGHAAESGKSLVPKDTAMNPVFLSLSGDSGSALFAGSGITALAAAAKEGAPFTVLFVNGTQDRTSSAEIRVAESKRDSVVYAYPNPVPAQGPAGELDFTKVNRQVTVDILSEDGKLVRSLEFSPAAALWSWDLSDGTGARARPGLYYYRVGSARVKALYLR